MGSASASAVGPPPGMAVRLSSNESPLGPSPEAVAAARVALDDAHLYPDDQSMRLRDRIATHEQRSIDEVVVGTGSAALLMEGIAQLAAGGSVVAFARSFIVYRLAAANVGAAYVEVDDAGPPSSTEQARHGYARDVERLLGAINDQTRVVVIDNPGNPTGTHLDEAALHHLINHVPEHVTIIIDEAYHHFALGHRGYATVDALAVDHPRLLVLRTFSKAYALAGMRVGYLMGPADILGPIDARRTRFNVTAPAQAAAAAALDDGDHLARTIAVTEQGRRRLVEGLNELGVCFTDGLGNFVTLELDGPSTPVVEAFAQLGIGVRPLEPYGMDTQIRVTVGTDQQLDVFLDAAAEVLANAGPAAR